MPNFLDALETTGSLIPLVVCGSARSGTRMVADLLNAHDCVAVQNEMHADTIEAFFALLDSIDKTFAMHSERSGKVVGVTWPVAKRRLAHAFLAIASKNRRAVKGLGKDGLRFHGIKTPGFERYFGKFDAIFNRHRPYYIYCLRSAAKVWRSWASLGYVDDVALFQMRYERSLRQALAIRSAAPERFVLFDLDAYLASSDRFEFVAENLFRPIGIKRVNSIRERLLNVRNRNSLERAGAPAMHTEQLESEMQALLQSDAIRAGRLALGASEFPASRPQD